MALSKENSSGLSPLAGLLDLLIDLQVVNSSQEFSKDSPPSNRDTSAQDETFSVPLVRENQASTTNDGPVLEADLETEKDRVREEEEEKSHSSPVSVSAKTKLDLSTPREFGLQENGTASEKIASSSFSLSKQDVEPENVLYAVEELQNLLAQSQQQADSPVEAPRNSTDSKPLASLSELAHNALAESRRQTQQTEVLKKSEMPIKKELNPARDSDSQPEQFLNRLIQSQWQQAQQKESVDSSIPSNGNQAVENSIELFERWQRLLLTEEVMDARKTIAKLNEKLESLEHQIYNPTELSNLLLPLIAEVLSRKVTLAREDVAQAIAPIIDEMIQQRSQQDMGAMSSALAPVLPEAVAQQVNNSPGKLARALGPEMSSAIKEQISLERDAMVDALYPVIGSTISKYMGEVIRTINHKVENALSLEGFSRKIRARMQGISEAELILKEAMPFTVQAMFLIHKASGLVISEVQSFDGQRLESDMLAGMLTAIRSFANDCIAQSGDISEIDAIDYGNSRIILEVAGYCYLAVVAQGEPTKAFTQNMRDVVSTIVQNHGKAIEFFDGNPVNVPDQIHQLLEALTKLGDSSSEGKESPKPIALMVVSLTVLLSVAIPLGIYQHLINVDRHHEREITLALESDPELAVYHLTVDANRDQLKLKGKLPNQYLRSKAAQIAKGVEPKLKINNAIIAVEVPPDPVSAAAEVKRVTEILNQMAGAVIAAEYSEGKVKVRGTVIQAEDAEKITQAFLRIPGVKSVTNTVQLQSQAIASRVYFERGTSELKAEQMSKILLLKEFLKQYPTKNLRLIGHTDPVGTAVENQPLALERAEKVRDILVSQGVDAKRLEVTGTTEPPLGVDEKQLPLLSRCVEFELIEP